MSAAVDIVAPERLTRVERAQRQLTQAENALADYLKMHPGIEVKADALVKEREKRETETEEARKAYDRVYIRRGKQLGVLDPKANTDEHRPSEAFIAAIERLCDWAYSERVKLLGENEKYVNDPFSNALKRALEHTIERDPAVKIAAKNIDRARRAKQRIENRHWDLTYRLNNLKRDVDRAKDSLQSATAAAIENNKSKVKRSPEERELSRRWTNARRVLKQIQSGEVKVWPTSMKKKKS